MRLRQAKVSVTNCHNFPILPNLRPQLVHQDDEHRITMPGDQIWLQRRTSGSTRGEMTGIQEIGARSTRNLTCLCLSVVRRAEGCRFDCWMLCLPCEQFSFLLLARRDFPLFPARRHSNSPSFRLEKYPTIQLILLDPSSIFTGSLPRRS